MSLFLMKSIIAVFFLLAALTAAFAMLTLMGKAEKKTGPETLRKIHKDADIQALRDWILSLKNLSAF